jgi:Cu/Zn superoxide dismutase
MMIIDESSVSNSAIQNTQEPTTLIISESTNNQHTEVSSSDNSAGQEGGKISITKKTSENIETTSNEENHSGMDALFGFSVEENTDNQPVSRIEKDVSAQ